MNEQDSSSKSPSQTAQIHRLARKLKLLRDPHGNAHVVLPSNASLAVPLEDVRVADYLRLEYAETHGGIPSRQSLEAVRDQLAAHARSLPNATDIGVRVAKHGNAVYLDLGRQDGACVEVTPTDIQLVCNPPVHFRRPKDFAELPEPDLNGSLEPMLELLNVRPSDRPIVGGYLVACLVPEIEVPILTIRGTHASGKSTLTRMLRDCVDPSTDDLTRMPTTDQDLFIHAKEHHVLAFDNLSGIGKRDLSDALCQITTGGTYTKRAHYQNGIAYTMSARNPMIFNGITVTISRHDLASRTLSIETESIPTAQRRSRQQLQADFRAAHPGALGSLLRGVQQCLKAGGPQAVNVTRMPDFDRITQASATSLGTTRSTVISAFQENQQRIQEDGIRDDCLGSIIQRHFDAGGASLDGTATELLTMLTARGQELGLPVDDLPSNAQKLSTRLRELQPSLIVIGVSMHQDRSSKVKRICISRDG